MIAMIQISLIFFSFVLIQIECEMVRVRTNATIKYFTVPTSDKPVISWLEVRKGKFPNTSEIHSPLSVGEPISILIYLKDSSYLYDVRVIDCWAYDTDNYKTAKNKLPLTEQYGKRKSMPITKWYKYKFGKGTDLRAFLHTNLTSFKFPDTNQLYLTCNVELCPIDCEKDTKQQNSTSLIAQE